MLISGSYIGDFGTFADPPLGIFCCVCFNWDHVIWYLRACSLYFWGVFLVLKSRHLLFRDVAIWHSGPVFAIWCCVGILNEFCNWDQVFD